MIVYKKTSWLKMFFTLKGSIVTHIIWRVVATTLFATVVTLLFDFEVLDAELMSITTLPFSLIGTALAIFLGFRNNSSYDRFWEGRKLWGRMINTTRTYTRQLMTLIDEEKAGREFVEQMVYRQIGYLNALRHHLRDEKDFSDCKEFISGEEYQAVITDPNAPIGMLHKMGYELSDAWKRGWIDTFHIPVFESTLALMTDIQGACERIKKTPIPFAYTVLMHRIVGVYCFALPFGIYEKIGDLTPVVVFLISYSFLGLDAIGDEIEEPFGHEPNDLPLSAFCNMLEREARHRLGEEELPEQQVPVDHVLN